MSTTFELSPRENTRESNAPVPTVQAISASPSRSNFVIPLFVAKGQLYYWTRRWQQDEDAALKELSEGQGLKFADGSSAADWLLDDED